MWLWNLKNDAFPTRKMNAKRIWSTNCSMKLFFLMETGAYYTTFKYVENIWKVELCFEKEYSLVQIANISCKLRKAMPMSYSNVKLF